MQTIQIISAITGLIAAVFSILIFMFRVVTRASMEVSFAEGEDTIRLKARREYEITFVHSNKKVWLGRAARDILFRAYFPPKFEVPEQEQLGLLKITTEPKDAAHPNHIAAVFITPFPLYPGVSRDLHLKIRTPKDLSTYKILVDVTAEGPKPLHKELTIEVTR
jgi:hypothetical protein